MQSASTLERAKGLYYQVFIINSISMVQRVFFLLMLYFSLENLYAQEPDNATYPKVGNPCPEFVLQHIKYYPTKKASLQDFRGKWLLLDFWNKSCASCIASFPHMNNLQEALSDQVQVMLVGIEDPGREIELIYEKFRGKQRLVIPCAFDSALAKKFDIYTAPYIIVLDKQGVVRAITSSIHTEEMRDFLAGKSPKLPGALRIHEEVPADSATTMIAYDSRQPLGIKNNGIDENDFLYRSMLTRWDKRIHRLSMMDRIEDKHVQQGRFEVLGLPLEYLYHYAYLGILDWSSMDSAIYHSYYPKLILEVKDSSVFDYSYKMNDCRNLYSYSLIMPPTSCSKEKIQEFMQEDLMRYFGYRVTLEMRKCPCWKVISTEAARHKLISKDKGEMEHWEGNMKVSFRVRNTPFKEVFDFIKLYNPGHVLVDETGLTERLDLTMDCENCVFVNSLEDVKKALQRNGLDLVRGEKEMKVLVVRDK